MTAARTAPVAAVIVLAAGEGTRMKSRPPRRSCTRSAAAPCSATCSRRPRRSSPEHLVVVVGHGREAVAEHLAEVAPRALSRSSRRSSTAPGTRCASRWRRWPRRRSTGTVRRGHRRHPAAHRRDAGRGSSTRARVDRRRGHRADRRPRRPRPATAASCAPPTARSAAIVEHKDADERPARGPRDQRGMYAFDAADARAPRSAGSPPTTPRARSTSPTSLGHPARRRPAASPPSPATDPHEILGVNDRVQLAEAGRLLRDRIIAAVDARRASRSSTPRPPGSTSTSSLEPRRRRPAAAPSCAGRRSSPPAPWSARTPPCVDCRGRRGRRVVRTLRADRAVDRPAARASARSRTCGPARGSARGQARAPTSRSRTPSVGEGSEGAAPVLRRRRRDRRGLQHRRGHRLRQLRRRRQAPHDRRRPRADRQRHHARRAGDGRRRRLHRGRLGHHRRRAARGDGRRPGAAAQRSRAGSSASAAGIGRGRGRPQAREAAGQDGTRSDRRLRGAHEEQPCPASRPPARRS